MLAYLARTLPVVFMARLRKGDGDRVSRLRHRVWPAYVDLNGHMNQAAYAQIMELGRLEWILRTGAWDRWRGQGVNPVVAEQRIVYRRELKPFAGFQSDTRAVGIEGRLLRFETHLLVGDAVHALGDVKLIFIGPDGVLDPAAVSGLCADMVAEPLVVEGWRVRG